MSSRRGSLSLVLIYLFLRSLIFLCCLLHQLIDNVSIRMRIAGNVTRAMLIVYVNFKASVLPLSVCLIIIEYCSTKKQIKKERIFENEKWPFLVHLYTLFLPISYEQ